MELLADAGFSNIDVTTVDCVWDLNSPDELFEIYARGTVRVAMLLANQPPQNLAVIRSALTLLIYDDFRMENVGVFLFRQRYCSRPLQGGPLPFPSDSGGQVSCPILPRLRQGGSRITRFPPRTPLIVHITTITPAQMPFSAAATARGFDEWGSTTNCTVCSSASSRPKHSPLPTLAGFVFIGENIASHYGPFSSFSGQHETAGISDNRTWRTRSGPLA